MRRSVLKAIMFSDIVGFGQFTDFEIERYFTKVLPQLLERLAKYKPESLNTWGDAIVAFFSSASDAALCALDFRDFIADQTWNKEGFVKPLRVRVGLHAADVYRVHNPIRGAADVIGSEVSLAARIEPITIPGEVFASEALVQLAKRQLRGVVAFERIGECTLPKGAGREKIFRLRRPRDRALAVDSLPFIPSPTWFTDVVKVYEEIASLPGKVKNLTVHAYNLGSTFDTLLRCVEQKFARNTQIKILIFDVDPNRLHIGQFVSGSGRSYLKTLRQKLASSEESRKAAVEYLMLGSELLAWNAESQEKMIDRLTERIFRMCEQRSANGLSLEVRRSSRIITGRMWFINDALYYTIYRQPSQLNPIIKLEKGNPLFTSFSDHFEYVWKDALQSKNSLVFEWPIKKRRIVQTSPKLTRS